jgi:hypothetical protein
VILQEANIGKTGTYAGAALQTCLPATTELGLIASLKPILDAEWEAVGSTISGCLRGTRLTVLKSILDWYTDRDLNRSIFWLTGDSGTGKSAIAYTSCRTFANKLSLGASFFFSRDQEQRSKIDHVFITLAYRLCFTFPQLRSRIEQALQDETLLTSPSLRRQLRELILIPICQEAGSLSSPILIVIDALDECDGTDGGNSIIQLIDILADELEAHHELPPLKFLVTSRPHEHLLRVFSREMVHSRTSLLRLGEVEAFEHEQDLRLFIDARLRDLASEYKVIRNIEGWPSDSDVTDLLNLSGGLFITAVTLLRMMKCKGEDNSVDPRAFLDQLRRSEHQTASLDEVYCDLLRMVARCHVAHKERNDLTLLLAFIVLAFDRLDTADIDALLGIQSQHFLPALRSVIDVPTGGGPLLALHASFHDFMVDPERCVGTPINHIDATLYHLKLGKICLGKLGGLKRDLLELGEHQGQSSMLITKASVKKRIALIPKELSYAIKHWSMHVVCARNSIDEEMISLLEVFVKSSIIHWVEALSYLGHLKTGMSNLKDLTDMLATVSWELSAVLWLLNANIAGYNLSRPQAG